MTINGSPDDNLEFDVPEGTGIIHSWVYEDMTVLLLAVPVEETAE